MPYVFNTVDEQAEMLAAIGAASIDDLFTEELFRAEELPPHTLGLQDNGKRNIEHEVMEMTRTLMMQNYAMQMMTSQYDLLEAVISGQA